MGWQAGVMALMTAASAQGQKNAADQNAETMRQEGALASAGANSNYAARLRKNTELMGANAAAAVESGGGVGGSTKGVLDQNAVNMELDALNEKYQGSVRNAMYQRQAGYDSTAGNQAAGATVARGVAGYLSSSYGSSGSGWTMGG
jgi:hypothetical protein